jgi:hypothetical protein
MRTSKIKFYTKPREPIPEAKGVLECVTREQYDRMVELVVKNNGCLWPDVITYAHQNLDYFTSIGDLGAILVRNDAALKAMASYELGIKNANFQKQHDIISSLWFDGAPEGYIEYLLDLFVKTKWDMLVWFADLTRRHRLLSEKYGRIASVFAEKDSDKRRKIPYEAEILACDIWWKKTEVEKEVGANKKFKDKQELLDYINEHLVTNISRRMMYKMLEKNRELYEESLSC